MSFSNRLPRGAKEHWRYNVIAPQDGLSDTIDQFLTGEISHFDINVMRDFTWYLVRVVLEPHEFIRESETVFRFENALGVLLDEDGNANGELVTITGSIGKEATSIGMPAGVLTMWKRRESIHPHAS